MKSCKYSKFILFIFLTILFSLIILPFPTSASNQSYNESLIQTGRDAMNMGEYETAIKIFDQAIINGNDLLTAYNNKGVSLMRLGRCNESVDSFGEAQKLTSSDQDLLLNLALALDCSGDRTQAYKAIQDGLRINSSNPKLYLLRSSLERDDQNFNESLEDIQRVISFNENDSEAWYEKAITHTMMKEYPDAYNAIQKAILLNPDDLTNLYNRGVIEEKLGKNQDAITTYGLVIKKDPSNVHALFNKASIYWNYYRLNESLESFNKVVELEPDMADAWFFRGLVLKELKEYEDASNSFKNAEELNPDNYMYKAYYNKYKKWNEATTNPIPSVPVSSLILLSILISVSIMIYSWKKSKK